MIRSQDLVPGSCLTSIIPLDLGYYTPKAHYEPVRADDGSPANFNAGVEGADQVFVYTSTMTGEEEKEEIKLSFNETGQFKIALFSDLHYGNQDLVCQDVPALVSVPLQPIRICICKALTYRLLRTARRDSRIASCPERSMLSNRTW